MQYLYKDDRYHFMDRDLRPDLAVRGRGRRRRGLPEREHGRRHPLHRRQPGDRRAADVHGARHRQNDPGHRGDTASGGSKRHARERGGRPGAALPQPGRRREGDTRTPVPGPRARPVDVWPARSARPARGGTAVDTRAGRDLAWPTTRGTRGGERPLRVRVCAARARAVTSVAAAGGRALPQAVVPSAPPRRRRHRDDRGAMCRHLLPRHDPDTAPFVNEGDTIKEGQTLCIIRP